MRETFRGTHDRMFYYVGMFYSYPPNADPFLMQQLRESFKPWYDFKPRKLNIPRRK